MASIPPLPLREKQRYYRAIYSLTKRGYLKKKGNKHALTNKCKEFFAAENKIKINIRRKRRWFLVSFDIPEEKSRERRRFRSFLKGCGFEKMHKSLWISPYDFEKEIKEAIVDLKIGRYVYIFKAEKINIPKSLRYKFVKHNK